MRNLKIKIITGFREDQAYTVDAEEAHKAYYLFLHPEERGIFKNGLAIIGKNIQGIEPDYHATMGWNQGYKLGPDDYADLRSKGVDIALRNCLSEAKEIAINLPDKINLPISEIKQQFQLSNNKIKLNESKFKRIGEQESLDNS